MSALSDVDFEVILEGHGSVEEEFWEVLGPDMHSSDTFPYFLTLIFLLFCHDGSLFLSCNPLKNGYPTALADQYLPYESRVFIRVP
jgi:hypothetical protein